MKWLYDFFNRSAGAPVNIAKLDSTNDEVRTAGKEELNPTTFRPFITDAAGRQIVRPWGSASWAQGDAPAVNTKATTTKAAGGAGVRHVCTGIVGSFAAGTSAPTAINLLVLLRDGSTGAGTVLWAATLSLPATAGQNAPVVVATGLNIRGSANTAMTLEFSVAGGANTFQCVGLQGVTITEA